MTGSATRRRRTPPAEEGEGASCTDDLVSDCSGLEDELLDREAPPDTAPDTAASDDDADSVDDDIFA